MRLIPFLLSSAIAFAAVPASAQQADKFDPADIPRGITPREYGLFSTMAAKTGLFNARHFAGAAAARC